MRHIKQRDDWGCGVACVAMVSGVDYRSAKAVMHGKREVDGTYTRHLIQALRHFDVPTGNRLIAFRGRSYRDLRVPAILKVNVRASGAWHWVVWDSRECRIRNPHDCRMTWRTAMRRYRPVSFLPVLEIESPYFR